MADKSLIINKLIGGGHARPSDVDYGRAADLLRLFGGRTATDYRAAAGMDGHAHPIPKPLYDSLLDHRAQLLNAALMAVRTLLDFDATVMAAAMSDEAPAAPAARGLAEVIRACAPLVERKGDWAALYMLLQEQGRGVGYTELCRIIREYAPDAPQPIKNDLAAAEWDTCRRRFPDWQPEGIQYSKFRRHYAIAKEAYKNL